MKAIEYVKHLKRKAEDPMVVAKRLGSAKKAVLNQTTLTILYTLSDPEWTEIVMDKIVNANKKSLSNVTIYLLDRSGDAAVAEICKTAMQAAPKAFIYRDCKGMSIPQCYNAILDHEEIGTDYITFADDAYYYANDALEVFRIAVATNPQTKLFMLRPFYFDQNGVKTGDMYYGRFNKVTEFNYNMGKLNLTLASYMWQLKEVEGLRFREEHEEEYAINYLIQILPRYKDVFILQSKLYGNYAGEKDFYNYPRQFSYDYYIPRMRDYIIPSLKAHPGDKFVQFVMYYQIVLAYLYNTNHRDKGLLLGEDVDTYQELVKEALQLIDDDMLMQWELDSKRFMPRYLQYYFWNLKTGKTQKDLIDGAENALLIGYTQSGAPIQMECYDGTVAEYRAINFDGTNLVIDIMLKNDYIYDTDSLQMYYAAGAEKKPIAYGTKRDDYSITKYFGRTLVKNNMYQFTIPVEEALKVKDFFLVAEYRGKKILPNAKFVKCQTHITQVVRHSFWNFKEGYTLIWHRNKKLFQVVPTTESQVMSLERKYRLGLKRVIPDDEMYNLVIKLRDRYYQTKDEYKHKTVWITFDQIFKGGDNGEYFYRYVAENKADEHLSIYYVMKEGSDGYDELVEKYHTVLPWDSFEQKLMALHADVVFATRVGANEYCGLDKQLEQYVRDLFTAEVVCLQHGLSIQKIAEYQSRLIDNTKQYMCVSPYEVKNISHPLYGYEPEDLVLTGAPRYDGLKNKDQKYILITPTWRRSVVAGTNNKGSEHNYSTNFKITKYYQIYQSLITNQELIKTAKETGYRLIYLIHPILSPQIGDFEPDPYVEIMPGTGVNYEKILTEASLMVTDYSGIQFDFAYMRKPIVYYHPDELPAQYEEGGLKYDTMGFGPVCRNEQSLVENMCHLMRQQCCIDEEYKRRADDFFAYDDHNNCVRVYEAAVKKYPIKK